MKFGSKIEGGVEETIERQEPSEVTHVKLSIFRHGDKLKPEEGQSADRVLLSEKGRGEAMDAADPDRDVRQSLSYGSTKERSRQTAAFKMAGHELEITGDESLEELEAKFDESLQKESIERNPTLESAYNKEENPLEVVGKKIGTDPRLDFELDTKTEYGKALHDSVKKDRYLSFLVEESDKLAKETGDTQQSTYSSMASGVADLIVKYAKVSQNWDRLYRADHAPEKENPKGYEDTLERLMGSHQGIGEAFLCEVMKRTEGEDTRDAFVESLNNKGFGDVEGFDLDISMREGGEPVIRITFSKEYQKDGETRSFSFDREVPSDILEEIAQMDRRWEN